MRKIPPFFYSIALIFTMQTTSLAQFIATDYTHFAVETALKNTLILVEQNDSTYNRALRKAAADWKLTRVQVLSEAAALKKAPDHNYSFFVPLEVSVKAANGASAKHYFIAIVNGGKKAWASYAYTDIVAYAPLDHFGNEKSSVEAGYRVALLLGSLNDAFRTATAKKIMKGKNGTLDAFVGIYNRRTITLKGMTLLMPQYYLDKTAQAAFAKQYPYPTKPIADIATLKTVLLNPSPKTAVFLISRSLNKHIFVLDATTGKVLYSDLYTSDAPLNAAELARFCRVAQGK